MPFCRIGLVTFALSLSFEQGNTSCRRRIQTCHRTMCWYPNKLVAPLAGQLPQSPVFRPDDKCHGNRKINLIYVVTGMLI
jgi:hypothetical protein